MGQHRQSRWSRRRTTLTVIGLSALLVAGSIGLRAGLQRAGDAEDKAAATSAKPSAGGATPAAPTRADAPQAFPGRPAKKTGVRAGSGLASGLGADAGDLAARAQDLVDGPEEQAPRPLTFVVSSFNVLGASHTSPRGNKSRYAGGDRRLGAQLGLLGSQDVDVVGFQEFESSQYRGFMRRTRGAWGVYPALSLGRNPVRNSIAWRRDVWDLADYGTIPIPYFRGNKVPMPVILLTHKQTKRQIYLINVHNPASNPRRGNNERWRDEATRRQLAKVRSLRQKAPRVPVILMGDFNERLEAYCRVTGGGGMVAANPGGDSSGCTAPALMGIDWIFGTADIRFTDYRRRETGGASDHPMLVTTATIE